MSKMKEVYTNIQLMLEQDDSNDRREYIAKILDVPLDWVHMVANDMAAEGQEGILA